MCKKSENNPLLKLKDRPMGVEGILRNDSSRAFSLFASPITA